MTTQEIGVVCVGCVWVGGLRMEEDPLKENLCAFSGRRRRETNECPSHNIESILSGSQRLYMEQKKVSLKIHILYDSIYFLKKIFFFLSFFQESMHVRVGGGTTIAVIWVFNKRCGAREFLNPTDLKMHL